MVFLSNGKCYATALGFAEVSNRLRLFVVLLLSNLPDGVSDINGGKYATRMLFSCKNKIYVFGTPV